MAQVVPPSGAGPQGAPGGPQQGQPAGGAEQAVHMIQQGFQVLGKMIQAQGQSLPPEDVKLFQGAVQATDAFIQAMSGPQQGQQPQAPSRPQQSGPMAPNAAAGSAQSPNQG